MDDKTVTVPCGDCTVCCKRDAVFLHPELGDRLDLYQTVKSNGRILLAHKKNGDCLYLDRAKGCTIYDVRPLLCRELDCRLLLDMPRHERKTLVRKKILNKKLVQAARKCKRRSGNDA